jgi:putative Holliday junction resolvase
VKILALDYGRARTGVAVSDPTGTVARPLGVIEYVDDGDGQEKLLTVIRIEEPDRIVVGLPLTLRGERGEQARETELFVQNLRDLVDAPIELFDERFTTTLAEGGGAAPEDARAAAHLLSSYLERTGRES